MRQFYIRLLRLHPRRFRERFAAEMLADYDLASRRDTWRVLGDAIASLFRQWLLRPESRDAPLAAVTAQPAGVPMFHSFEDYKPRRSALMYGSTVSTALLLVVVFAIGHGEVRRGFSIGIRRPGSGLIPIDRAAFHPGKSATEVRVGSEPVDALLGLAAFYLKTLPFGILDSDRDSILSAGELSNAPAVLARLDRNHDGNLSPEECGFQLDPGADHYSRLRIRFMQVHPILAALDRNADGYLSAEELRRSPASLRRLDQNFNGALSPVEILPDSAAAQASLIFVRLDADGDGRISSTEMNHPSSKSLVWADTNQDGTITQAELLTELRRRSPSIRK